MVIWISDNVFLNGSHVFPTEQMRASLLTQFLNDSQVFPTEQMRASLTHSALLCLFWFFLCRGMNVSSHSMAVCDFVLIFLSFPFLLLYL